MQTAKTLDQQEKFKRLWNNAAVLLTLGLVTTLISFSPDELLVGIPRLVSAPIIGDTSLVAFLFISPALMLGLSIYVGILFYAMTDGRPGSIAASFSLPNVHSALHRRVMTVACWIAVYVVFPIVLGCIAYKIAPMRFGIVWCVFVASIWIWFHYRSLAAITSLQSVIDRIVRVIGVVAFAALIVLAFCCVEARRLSMDEAQLSGLHLNDINLERANLRAADFSGSNMRCSRLDGALGSFAQFDGANMRGASASGAILMDADFYDANLIDAVFNDALLTRARFDCAQIAYANFDGARELPNLSNACFSETDTSETNELVPDGYQRPVCCALDDVRPSPPCNN